jgi:hypothetical protein
METETVILHDVKIAAPPEKNVCQQPMWLFVKECSFQPNPTKTETIEVLVIIVLNATNTSTTH